MVPGDDPDGGNGVALAPGRFLLAAFAGHLAAAYAFCATLLAAAVAGDLVREGGAAFARATWTGIVEGLLMYPVVSGALALFAMALMAPFTLLVSPLAYLVARRRRTGPATTSALGSATGALFGILLLTGALDFLAGVPVPPGQRSRGNLWLADPTLPIGVLGACAAAGGAFAWVLWRLCMRPRPVPVLRASRSRGRA